MKLNIKIAVLLLVGLFGMANSHAYTMTIEANKWQLISFPKLPENRSVEDIFGEAATGGKLIAIWGFDNSAKSWNSWPTHAQMPNSNLSQLEPGNGYWVKTSEKLVLDIQKANNAAGEVVLYPGWNLVGLSMDSAMSHDQALAGVPYVELWSYDVANNKFLTVQKSRGSQIILKEEFNQVLPGRGYWLYMAEQTNLLPQMGTLLPPDIDLEPLLSISEYGKETTWENMSPGDIDWDGDGFFDFPNTQQTVSFGDFLNRQRIAITNEGNGVLSWQATIEPSVKWLLFEAFDEKGNPVLTNRAGGSVSDTNGELILVVNRVGLAPSDNYKTQVVLRANGGVQEKRIDVNLAVADVVGDYEVTVRLDEVGDKKADLHNPKYFLSFARDGEGVKAFLDEERSLLIPETTYLSGSYIADPESHFQVLGQLYLPKGHDHNPYQGDIRREFTLIGQRSDGRDGLSPLDIKGTYAENIYGIFEDPIQLKGEFVAKRLSPIPKKKDFATARFKNGEIVSKDTNEGISEFDLSVNERYSITDIKSALKISHSEPDQLVMSLISPKGTTVKLHEKQNRSLKEVRFDDYDDSVESMDLFDGQLSRGTWKLRIQNYSSSVGTVNEWSLDISGAKVYQITGTTDPGIRLQLSGCGIVRSVITGPDGKFSFDGLIPCDYDISVVQLGYEVTTTPVRIQGCLIAQGNPCDQDADYIQALTSAQLAKLKPKLVATSGTMKVIVSPKSAMLSNNPEEKIQLQAVDVTNYSGLNKTLLSRKWELYKRVNSWSAINAQGYLVDVEAYDNQVPAGNNHISYSEDISKWNPNHRVQITQATVIDPRGGYGAAKVETVEAGYPSIFNSNGMGEKGFELKKDEYVTFSVFLKPGTTEEVRFRFASEKGFYADELVNFTTGEHTGGQDQLSNYQVLANGWYRASVTVKANDDFSNFYVEFFIAKSGSVTNVPTGESLYVFGPQAEIHSFEAPMVPISIDNVVVFVPQQNMTGYIATGFSHGTRSAQEQLDVLIASKSTNTGSWSYEFDNTPSHAGIYYVKLHSGVKNSSNQNETLSYTTDYISLAYADLNNLHFGIRSVHAAAGSAGMKAMDMATFDINRPPLDGGQGPEDSDSFKSTVSEATETNETNNLFQNPEDPSQSSFEPTGMDDPSGNLNKHYRMYISTGQLYHGGSAYGGNFRLDIGVQSAGGNK